MFSGGKYDIMEKKWRFGIKRKNERRVGASGMKPSHLVPEAGQGRGTPGRQDFGRRQLQFLQG